MSSLLALGWSVDGFPKLAFVLAPALAASTMSLTGAAAHLLHEPQLMSRAFAVRPELEPAHEILQIKREAQQVIAAISFV